MIFVLHVHTSGENDHTITEAARHAFEKMKSLEQAARSFAAEELLSIHNSEWSEGKPIHARLNSWHVLFLPPSKCGPMAMRRSPTKTAICSGDTKVGVRFRYGQFTEAVVQG